MPSELEDTGEYTVGPVEYARPDVASDFGGVSVNNFAWWKDNDETVTKAVVGLET